MQKITLILTLIQLCLSNNITAQSKYFEKSFGWLLVHNGHIVSKTTDGYFISCDAIGMSGDNWNVYSIFVDEYGELTDSVHYGFPSNDYGAAILGGIITEYGYALCGYAGNNQNLVVGNQCYLLQTNSDGSLIDSIWTGANNSVSYTIARTPDNGYLLGGYRRIIDNNGNFSYPYLLRLDANFNTVWDTTYQLTNFFGYYSGFTKIIPNHADSTYYLVGNINNFEDVNDVLWLHINEQGHILHQRVITEPEYFSEEVVSDFIKTTDGDFVLGITKYNNGPAKAGIILKLSPNGDTIRWAKKVFDLGVVSKIYQLPDSSYLVAGEASPSATNPPFNAAIAHVSANGDSILWRRSYGGSSPDYIYDFIPTSDGGYFFVGRTESPDLGVPTGGANVYLLKTNCMGLLTEPQANFTTQIDTAALTASFYNLSQFVYPDSIDGGHYLWDFGDGTTSAQINPTHTYAHGGNYTVTLTAVVCSDTSVYTLPVSTYAVGINQVWVNPKFSHFVPNPTKDQLFLDYALDNEQQATISLFDLNGRIVKQDKLTGNGKLQWLVDTLPSGFYYYQIQQNNETIITNKVIIIK